MSANVSDPNFESAYSSVVTGIADGAFAFIGAGASRWLGYITWYPLLDHLHKKCESIGVNTSKLETIKLTEDSLLRAELYEAELTREKLIQEIESLYGENGKKSSSLHKAIVAVDFDHYLTTNYDLGIEAAYSEAGWTAEPIDLGDVGVMPFVRSISSNIGIRKTVLHIHGRVNRPESVVLSLKDYRNVYNLNPKFQQILSSLLFVKSFVFIGYSFSDPPFTAILDKIASFNNPSDRTQHWAIMACPKNPESERLRLKHNYNIETIFYDAQDGKHDELAKLVARLAQDVKKCRSKQGRLVGPNFSDKIANINDAATNRDDFHDGSISKPSQNVQTLVTQSSVSTDEKTPTDLRIDAQVEVMKAGFYEQARQKFVEILDGLPADTEKRLRFRLHANIGHAFLQLDKKLEAVPHYEEAYANAPDLPDAQWMYAFSAELMGFIDVAVSRINTLLEKHPDHVPGHALKIRCANENVTLRKIKQSVPRSIRRSTDVAVALSNAADKRNCFKSAESYVRHVIKRDTKWGVAYTLLGVSILKKEMGGDYPSVDYRVIPANRSRIEEAIGCFTKTIEIMRQYPATPQLAIAFLNRASAKRFLGDDPGAHLDVTEANKIDPNDNQIAAKYAHSLYLQEQYNEAIDFINGSVNLSSFIPARFIRLMALAERRKPEDMGAAISEAKDLVNAKAETVFERADAHAILCNLLIENKTPNLAIEHLRSINDSELPPGLRNARLANLIYGFVSKDSEEAISLLTDAIKAARSISPWFARREIAHICALLGRFRDAADILATIITPELFSEETEAYFTCLLKSKQYLAVISYCKTLRSKMQYTADAMHAECDSLLAIGESREAIALLDDWLAWRPDDKISQLHRSLICIRRGEVENATFDPSKLPRINEIRHSSHGVQTAYVLSHGPNPAYAAGYALELARKYPDDEEIQFTLIETILIRKSLSDHSSEIQTVQADHAVLLKSPQGDVKRVIRLVKDKVQHPDEFLITHEIAKPLLGKRIGDQVKIGNEEMTIVSVVMNAALAADEALQQFSIRFPKSKLIRGHKLPATPINPTHPKDVLGDEWWEMVSADDKANQQAFELYQQGKMPLSMMARKRGKTIFETAFYVINTSEFEVMSAPQNTPYIQELLKQVHVAKSIVIDPTALATVFAFDMIQCLKQMPYKFIVPDSALNTVKKAKYEADQGMGMQRMGLKDGKFFLTEHTPEEMKVWSERLSVFITEMESIAEICGGSSTEIFVIENKEHLMTYFGDGAFDAIAIAAERSAILWTDDQMFGRIAKEICNVPFIWTQGFLHVSDKKSGKNLRGKHLPQLLEYRYNGTVVFIRDIEICLREFKWSLSSPQLKSVISYIRDVGCLPHNWQVMRNTFSCIWIMCKPHERNKATKAIWIILNQFDRKIARKHIARPIYKHLDIQQTQYVPAFSRFRNVFRRWAAKNS